MTNDLEEPRFYCGTCGKELPIKDVVRTTQCVINGKWNYVVTNKNSPGLKKIISDHGDKKCPWCDK